ncbi:unnamed protein product [Scytosiphon promiscuus]
MAGGNDSLKALGEAAGRVFDLMVQSVTPEKLAEWLKAPLEQAAAHGDQFLAGVLMGAGAAAGSALHNAVRGGHVGMVNSMLEKGTSANAEDENGEVPLHVACLRGNPDMIRSLLRGGARVDELDRNGLTPLYVAAYTGDGPAVRALLTAGADVTIRCGDSLLPLMHVAAHAGRVNILRLLLDNGASVKGLNAHGDTPLHFAAFSSKLCSMRLLLEAGADINARDDAHGTPLNKAVMKSLNRALLALRAASADENPQDDPQLSPSQVEEVASTVGDGAEAVDLLLRAGADETIVNSRGETILDIVGHVEELGKGVASGYRPAEDFTRMCRLLANAPADKAWRRRRLLVMCRSHPTRVELKQEDSQPDARMIRRARGRAKQSRVEAAWVGFQSSAISGVGEGGTTQAKEAGYGNTTDLIARVLELAEEEVFRTIVGYI